MDNKVFLAYLAILESMEHQVIVVLMDNQVKLEVLGQLDYKDNQEALVSLDQLERKVLEDHRVHPEYEAIMDSLDLKDLLVAQAM